MKKPLAYNEFKAIYSKVPRLTVEVICTNPSGVLLTKRTIEPYKDLWHIPGGTVHMRETLLDACRRISKEELGFIPDKFEHVGYIEYLDYLDEKHWFDWPIGIAFHADLSGQKAPAISINDESSDAKFFKKAPKNVLESQAEFLKEKGFIS
jgi:ADP-ribose pyrophosphatase YjhB (NUDIX family)